MSLNHLQFSKEKNTLTKKYLVPKRVVLAENAKNLQWLLCDTKRQSSHGDTGFCTLKEGGYVVLDFGSELQGGVDITVIRVQFDAEEKKAMHPYGKLRIVFGESVSEALSKIGDEKKAQNDHSTRDMTVETCRLSSMRYGNTGFRFVKIEAVEGDSDVSVVKGVLEYKDIEYKGSFRCNDERLNNIFDTAAYTVHLNMQDYIWDGIKRDRLVWVGDMHPEVSTICSVFGYDDSVERSLDFARDSYPIPDDNQTGGWMVFPSYTCWWITIHRDWYMQNGKLDYLNEQKVYMYKAVNSILARVGTDGSIDFDEKYFIDWSSNQTPYMEAGFRGCLILGLESAAQIFAVYGDSKMQDKCLAAVKNVKKILPAFSGNKQVTAIAGLSGLCDSKAAEEIITKDLLEGLSTFYGYYVLNFLAKAGNMQAALEIMRGYWGAMLDHGATTFWEDFDIAWIKNAGRIDEVPCDGKIDIHGNYGKFCYQNLRHSLCHGWASGPADFMSKHILGVQILEPGCKKVRISPMLGDLEWAQGTYPTPYGVITIEHRKENGKIKRTITAPCGVEIVNG